MQWNEVGVEFSAKERDLMVYSSDASLLEMKPKVIFYPKTKEDVQNIVRFALKKKLSITPRGGGTGLAGGAVGNEIIIDLSKMNKFKIKNQLAIVEPGVILSELNNHLLRKNIFFPIIPSSEKVCTIGGMISTNAAGLRALRFGWTKDWIKEITIVDGMGEIMRLQGERAKEFCGSEGILGIVVEAKLKLTKVLKEKSMSLIPFNDFKKMVETVKNLKDEATFIEYIDSYISSLLNLKKKPHLIIGFEDSSGEIKDEKEVERIVKIREGVYPILASNGFFLSEDPLIPLENMPKFLEWLFKNKVYSFGHIAVGIIHPCFSPVQETLISKMYKLVRELDGKVSGEHGYGLKKSKYLNEFEKRKFQNLKKKYDPNGILNPGKILFSLKASRVQNKINCVQCGMCKVCPVFLVTRNETIGPRGRGILAKRLNDPEVFYNCTLCKACEFECPSKIKLPDEIRKMREFLVSKGFELEQNKKMIDNIRKYGNPFGEVKEGIKEWYCC